MMFPVDSLDQLNQQLPHLTTITVKPNAVKACDGVQLSMYLDTFFLAIQHCSKLAALHILDPIGPYLTLTCGHWQQLPSCLRHLECLYGYDDSQDLDALLRRVPNVTLRHSPRHNLVELLDTFPIMKTLQVEQPDGDYIVLCCGDEACTGQQSAMRQRLLGGQISLGCHAICLNGTSAEIQDVLTWLPPFPYVNHLLLYLQEDVEHVGSPVHCLENLARVFPGAAWITLNGSREWATAWQLEAAFFAPAAATLTTLHLDVKFPSLTTAGLVQLCGSLGKLEDFSFEPCSGVSERELGKALKGKGRKVVVNR